MSQHASVSASTANNSKITKQHHNYESTSIHYNANFVTNRSNTQLDFKSHIDKQHFATIQEKNSHISVVCVLCEGVSQDLQGHRAHLIEKHPYVKTGGNNYSNKNTRSQQSLHAGISSPYSPNRKSQVIQLSNKLLKSKLKQLDSISRLRIIEQLNPNQFIIEFQSREYVMYKQSKEYNGMEYDQTLIFPQLVLFPVFSMFKQRAKFYVLQKFPLQKTIQCNAYIICEKQ